MAALVTWKRLVRYTPAGDSTRVCYGDPILKDDSLDVGDLADNGELEVEVLEGDDPLSSRPTGRRDKVGRLLGPLEPKDVPLVRCIGLNYKSHSTCSGLLLEIQMLKNESLLHAILDFMSCTRYWTDIASLV